VLSDPTVYEPKGFEVFLERAKQSLRNLDSVLVPTWYGLVNRRTGDPAPKEQPHSGLRSENIAKFQLPVTLSAGTLLCPYGIAYCRVYG
jgi:hypothetical protein